MSRAVDSISRVAPKIPPESNINATLDPTGRTVDHHLHRRASPDKRVSLSTVFIKRHLIADEIERLIAMLDALDDVNGYESNFAGWFMGDTPVDEVEGEGGVDCDDEPSLSAFDGAGVSRYHCDFEFDLAETGIGDLDGLLEQTAGFYGKDE